MSQANTPKTSVSAPLVKIYKILLRFALGPLVSEILKNKEECHQGSAEARFYSWKVLLLRARRMFLWTVLLPFCIHVTIATNTTLEGPYIRTIYLDELKEEETNHLERFHWLSSPYSVCSLSGEW